MRFLAGFTLLRVNGHSMIPTAQDGDYILLRRYGKRRQPAVGDVVVYPGKTGALYVKRLVEQRSGHWFRVQGDGALSAPSVDLGEVNGPSLLGKVIHIIGKSGRGPLRHQL